MADKGETKAAAQLSAQSFRVRAGEQPQGCFQPDDSEKKIRGHQEKVMGQCIVVSLLFRGQLWRCPDQHHSPVH
jgi:hypothetical protein